MENSNKSLIGYLREFSKFAKAEVVFYIILSFLSGILEGIGISILIPILNFFTGTGTGEKSTLFFKDVLGFFNLQFNLFNILIFLIVTFFLKAIIVGGVFYYRMDIRELLAIRMQKSFIQHLCEVKYSWFKNAKEAKINNILVNEVRSVVNAFEKISQVITGFLNFVVFSVVLLFINDLQTISYLLPFLFLMPLLFIFAKKIKKGSHRITAINHEVQDNLFQLVRGFKYLKARQSFERFFDKLNNLFKEKKKLSVAVYLFVSAPSILTEFFAVCLVSMFIWIFVVQLNRPISEILVTIVFIQRIMVNIVTLITNRNSFLADAGSLNNYYYFLDEMKKHKSENVNERKTTIVPSAFNLEFKNVSFNYDGQPVLQDVSFNLKKGEKVGLVGLSGEGKTTLFDLALGLLKPAQGSIFQNGKNLNDLSEKEISSVIGFVPQEPVVFNHGLKENIFWFVPDESKIKSEVLRKGVESFMQSQNRERDGDMHQGFSGGQKQKIAFFRELLHRPEILFVDEGTSSMDSIAEKEFMDYINNSLHQTSVLMIAHRLSSLRDCDRIIVLSKGKIIEEGSWNELESRRESFFSQLLERQSKDKK